jgi:type IV secretion system protein VirD4
VSEGISLTDPREQSGIFSTCDGLLAAYRTNATLTAAANPNFDPAAFAASGDTIYICAPATAQAQHAALVVALLDHVRTHVYRRRPYPAVLWALDEMANIAPLPTLPATVAEGGSQGLVIEACLRDLSQARRRWGPAADGFLTLFTHKIVLPGVADITTLRQISALAGDIDIAYRSVSKPRKLLAPATVTTHMQQRPRLPLDTIAAGAPGQALHLVRSSPCRINLHPLSPPPAP